MGVNNIEIVSTQALANQEGLLKARKDKFSSDGVSTSVILPYTPVSESFLQVFIGGIRQHPDTFSLTGSGANVITFTEAPPAGSFNVEIVYLIGDGVTAEEDLFSGDGSTLVFTTSFTITDSFGISVYVDGVYERPANYSVSGNQITFSTAPVSGSEILVVQVTSPLTQTNVANFTTDGVTQSFDTGITGVLDKYVDVYYNGVYQQTSSYTYANGVVTFYGVPPASVNSL